jgi:hypothetical protein
LEPLRDPLFVRPPSVPAAHGIMLLPAARLTANRFSVCRSESATQPVY